MELGNKVRHIWHHQFEGLAHVAHVQEAADLHVLGRYTLVPHGLPTALLQVAKRRRGALWGELCGGDEHSMGVFLDVVGNQHAEG